MPDMPPTTDAVTFHDCYARWTADEFVLGNAAMERRWRVDNGVLHATALTDRALHYEWVGCSAASPAPRPAHPLPDEPRRLAITAHSAPATATGADALFVELVAAGATCTLKYHFRLFPGVSGISLQLSSTLGGGVCAGSTATADDAPTGIECTETPAINADADCIEQFTLRSRHLLLRQVLLADQTDSHNELVQEREWMLYPRERISLCGNLFVLFDPLTDAGLVMLKEAPLPHARPRPCARDLVLEGGDRLALYGHGMSDEIGEGYPATLLTFTGGRAGCTAALQQYQRRLRCYDAARDGQFLSNTWGDRSQDARITEAFILREIEAGARLGVDVLQIDDGWQAGRTSNSTQPGGVWEGFWHADGKFWEPSTTGFPRGLQPIIDRLRAHNMRLGLWFAPDSSAEFANWSRDAETILHLHRAYGVRYVKIDGVKARTRLGETRLHRLIDTVLRESRGQVVFDLDITAEIRPGYFGLMHAGPLFVENRYTDWLSYWPHLTLRNLWSLAQYIDPLRLRMELLNNQRNVALYADDPLAPARYSPAYLFAVIMVANPLGWFEVSNLSANYAAAVAPLVSVWKAHRARLHSGQILPIGERPDGTSWTGFASRPPDHGDGYLLLFRETNNREVWDTPNPFQTETPLRCTVLAGEGTVQIDDGCLTAHLP